MLIAEIVVAVVFALGAGVLGMVALRAGRDQVPFGSPLGLPGVAVRRSTQVWDAAHRKAVPYFWSAAVICLIQALAAAAMMVVPSLASPGYLAALVVTGLLLIGTLAYLASRP